jgi:hypothetical protein
MFLKELLLGLNRTLWGQFLREICPFKKMTPKVGRKITAITEKLLMFAPMNNPNEWSWYCNELSELKCMIADLNSFQAIRVFVGIFY